MWAAIDNTVCCRAHARTRRLFSLSGGAAAANVENMFNRQYYVNADSNTNISPGSPRAVRVGVTATF